MTCHKKIVNVISSSSSFRIFLFYVCALINLDPRETHQKAPQEEENHSILPPTCHQFLFFALSLAARFKLSNIDPQTRQRGEHTVSGASIAAFINDSHPRVAAENV